MEKIHANKFCICFYYPFWKMIDYLEIQYFGKNIKRIKLIY